MNDKDKEAFHKFMDEYLFGVLSTNTERQTIYDTWQAACEYKDKELINGSKMKQMNDRVEDLITENKKLREALQFYADKDWEIQDEDGGAKAKEALKKDGSA
jgi:formiminotetrahydrofolate cyclodeaminase